ncbi:MAG: helix-turn-helix domain-containing protein [Eubacterium sp.]|nr:helix-turn-helix domain-containing protein [Eubacterium sp.]
MRFDENLRNLRKEKDYSQEYLAEKLGVTRQTISKWENGSAMPDLKKLIELAEFFEVSMDNLLGLKYEENDNQQTNNTARNYNETDVILANRYTNDLVNTVSNRINCKTKALTVWIVIIAIVLAVTIISLSGKISSLEIAMNNNYIYLQERVNSHGSQIYDDEEYYDVEINVIKINPETPCIAEMELKYSPTSYPKNTKIYYLIPKKDGGVARLEAEDNNGEFVLNTDIDFSMDKPIYFVLDDGENIIKQEVYMDIGEVFGTSQNFITYEMKYKADSEFVFSNSSSDVYVWTISKYVNIASADIVVSAEGKEVFRQELKKSELKRDDENSYYEFYMPAFPVKDLKVTQKIDIYIEVMLENVVICKEYIPYRNSMNSSNDSVEEQGCREYVFTVGDKTVTIDSFKE